MESSDAHTITDLQKSVMYEHSKVHLKGLAQQNTIRLVANSQTNSQIVFDFQVNPNDILDKKMILEMQLQMTATGPGNRTTLELQSEAFPAGFCLRQLPLNSLIDTMSIRINNSEYSTSPATFAKTLLRCSNKDAEWRRRHLSTIGQPDYSNDYSALSPLKPDYTGLDTNTVMPWRYSAKNPDTSALNRGCQTSDGELIRSAHPYTEAINPTAQTAVRTWLVQEPLYHPLLSFENNEGFTNVNHIRITLNLNPDLLRCFSKAVPIDRFVRNNVYNPYDFGLISVADNNTITVNQAYTFAPLIVGPATGAGITTYLTYQTSTPIQEVPKIYQCPVKIPETNEDTTGAPLVFGATNSVTYFRTLTLNQVPSHMILLAPFDLSKGQTSNVGPQTVANYDPLTCEISDGGMTIQSLNITVNNETGICSSMSLYDLWKTSAKNGLDLNFDQYQRFGSVIVLKFGEDLCSSLLPGQLGTFMFRFSCVVTNNAGCTASGFVPTQPRPDASTPAGTNAKTSIGANARGYILRCIFLYDGVLEVTPQQVSLVQGSENYAIKQGLETLVDASTSDSPNLKGSGLMGGSFASGWQKFLRGAKGVLGTVANVGGKVLSSIGDPRAQLINQALQSVNTLANGNGYGGRLLLA